MNFCFRFRFQINFAEAALFLQGTASVYSKKVEFLWQTVLSMLDTLASKRALEEASGPDGGGGGDKGKRGRSKGGLSYDPNNFSLITLELSRNNDLKAGFFCGHFFECLKDLKFSAISTDFLRV